MNIQPYEPTLTGMDVLEQVFGSFQQEVIYLKLLIAILLFAFLFKGAEMLFQENRGSAVIIALITSVIATVFIPNEYILALATGFGATSMAILFGVLLVLPWLFFEVVFPVLKRHKIKWVVYAVVYGLWGYFFSQFSNMDIFDNLRRVSPAVERMLDFLSGTGVTLLWVTAFLCLAIFVFKFLFSDRVPRDRDYDYDRDYDRDRRDDDRRDRRDVGGGIDWSEVRENAGKAAEGVWKGAKRAGDKVWKGAKVVGKEAKYQIQYEDIRRKYEGYMLEEGKRINKKGMDKGWDRDKIRDEIERSNRYLRQRMERELGRFRESIGRDIRRAEHQKDAEDSRSREITKEIYGLCIKNRKLEGWIEELNDALHKNKFPPEVENKYLDRIKKLKKELDENNRKIRNEINKLPPDLRHKIVESLSKTFKTLRRWM
jgi:hypothetical protein